jgi:hypothetical protein
MLWAKPGLWRAKETSTRHPPPAAYRPDQDYGGGLKTLALCPPSPNCISTAEEANDPQHYVPQW